MDTHHGWYVNIKPLLIGWILSLVFTIGSYFLVFERTFIPKILAPLLFILALFQALVQLIYFMHLGIESKPKWNLLSFFFLIVVMIIIIGGSIWIMNNLDYNVMPDMRH